VASETRARQRVVARRQTGHIQADCRVSPATGIEATLTIGLMRAFLIDAHLTHKTRIRFSSTTRVVVVTRCQ